MKRAIMKFRMENAKRSRQGGAPPPAPLLMQLRCAVHDAHELHSAGFFQFEERNLRVECTLEAPWHVQEISCWKNSLWRAPRM